MKRLFVIFQWLVFIAMIVVFAWGVLRQPPTPDYHPTEWRSWDGFSVISYSGVPRDSYDRYIDKHGLAEHLEALKEAGFKTIKPEDAAAFLEGRAPLPEKALLILFEGGRKDSFIAATPLLRKTGLVATYGVPSGLTEKWGSFYVRKADIGKLADDPHWSFASMGHRAFGTIPVDAEKEQKGFLTHRMWWNDRLETDAEVRARIMADYVRSAALIERESGVRPVAFIAPYQVGGPWKQVEDAVMRANNIGIDHNNRIAFMRHEGSFNAPGTAPHNLTRMNAGGKISGHELVKKLQAALPRSGAVEGIHAGGAWFTIGPARATEGMVIASTSGRAWLQGSSGWSDLELRTKVKRWTTNVLGAVYVRYTSPESYLRVAIASDVIRVQERIGKTMQTLAQHTVSDPSRVAHELLVRVKGNRAWVTVDGTLIGGAPVPLTFATVRGAIGLTSDTGNTELTDFSAKPIASIHAFAQKMGDLPAQDRDAVVTLLPSWFRATDRMRMLPEQARLDALVAGSRGIETIPVVEEATNVVGDAATALARRICSMLDTPATKTLVGTIALRGANLTTASVLEERGYQVVLILSAMEARLLSRTNPELFLKRTVIVDCAAPGSVDEKAGEEGVRIAVDKLLRVCSADRIIICGAKEKALPRGVGTALKFAPATEARP